MILEPTVFIVGAGASQPYQFPLGKGLVRSIIDQGGVDGAGAFCDDIRAAGQDGDHLKRFLKALRSTEPQSIDEFLQYRKEYLEVGKACIARALIPHEHPKRLRAFQDPSLKQQPTRNWVRYLINAMHRSFGGRPWDDNQLSIITFNFDRSFEQIAFNVLRGFSEQDEEAIRMVRHIPVFHIHGTLGAPAWLDTGSSAVGFSRPYSPDCTPAHVIECAKLIKIVHEEIDQDMLAAAHEKLAAARRICFLGFSYHPLNLAKLNISALRGKTLAGTRFGMSDGQLAPVNQAIQQAIVANMSFSIPTADTLKFLEDADFVHF